jgi:hypothetical protein
VNLLPFASESGAAFDGEKGGKWSQKLLPDFWLCATRTHAPAQFFMEKKYFCLGQARLNRSVFICAALEYSAHVYLRLMGNIN